MDALAIARARIAREAEEKTGFLDLGMLGLNELPDELFALTHLRRLNLGEWFFDEGGKLRRPEPLDRAEQYRAANEAPGGAHPTPNLCSCIARILRTSPRSRRSPTCKRLIALAHR